MVIPDVHCPCMRKGFVSFLKRTADKYQPSRVVQIGDLLDWHALSFHEKHPKHYGASQEAKDARSQISKLVKEFPKADWLLGNHDVLPERKAATLGIPPDMLKGYADYWGVPWTVHPRFHKLLIDGVIYAHGDGGAGGKFSALTQAMANFQSTVIGHFHSHAGVMWWANAGHRVFGMNVGCGIDVTKHQFEYGVRYAAKPILGCGVVVGGQMPLFVPWLL